jgi:hypothetical protein
MFLVSDEVMESILGTADTPPHFVDRLQTSTEWPTQRTQFIAHIFLSCGSIIGV